MAHIDDELLNITRHTLREMIDLAGFSMEILWGEDASEAKKEIKKAKKLLKKLHSEVRPDV